MLGQRRVDSAERRWGDAAREHAGGFDGCARDAGCQALVLTIDNQLLGQRERDLANGFSIPPRFSARQLLAMAAKWRWGWSMRRELRTLTFGNYVRPGSAESLATLAGRMGSLLDPAMNWDDVAQLRAQGIRAELDLTMALTGCRTLAEVTRDRLVEAPIPH